MDTQFLQCVHRKPERPKIAMLKLRHISRLLLTTGIVAASSAGAQTATLP